MDSEDEVLGGFAVLDEQRWAREECIESEGSASESDSSLSSSSSDLVLHFNIRHLRILGLGAGSFHCLGRSFLGPRLRHGLRTGTKGSAPAARCWLDAHCTVVAGDGNECAN